MALPLVGPEVDRAPRGVEGRVALVTGSSSNLGRAALLELARRGADVIVNGRSNREEAGASAAQAAARGVRAIAILAAGGGV
jgi:NAD(P)-dependent dehydrogenase (short-subunit alcohol dehydrogenase family)